MARHGWLAVLILVVVSGMSSPAHAQTTTLTIPMPSTFCTGGGQVCNNWFTSSPISVPKRTAVTIAYTVGPHCSGLKITVTANGRSRMTQMGWPGGPGPTTTGPMDFGTVEPPSFRIEVRAEGILGGCNSGTLGNWTGTLTVTLKPEPCDINRAVSFTVSNMTPCGSTTVGTLTPTWGSFGTTQTIEADSGESLTIRCDGGVIPSYHLYFSKPGGPTLRVGECPFYGGCNSVTITHAGDADGNGKIDCFLETQWLSRDYGNNDPANRWTDPSEPTPILDHALSIYNVNADTLFEINERYLYGTTPPIVGCGTGRPEGAPLPSIRRNNTLAEAVLSQVFHDPQQLETQEPMVGDPYSPADLNRDGALDMRDSEMFLSAFGSCEGQASYDRLADYNRDGCVNAGDVRVFLDLFRERSSFDGGGQRPRDVNKFLSYANPTQNHVSLPAGTTSVKLMIFYDANLIAETFQAEVNGVNVTSDFTPKAGGREMVEIPLRSGRNVLVLSVDGNAGKRLATDTDRLVFEVP